jgi:cysteine sulfinate desulfinase/cysteine desulfurase-like protein
MGASDAEVRGCLRLSLGRFTTEAQLEAAAAGILEALPHARARRRS